MQLVISLRTRFHYRARAELMCNLQMNCPRLYFLHLYVYMCIFVYLCFFVFLCNWICVFAFVMLCHIFLCVFAFVYLFLYLCICICVFARACVQSAAEPPQAEPLASAQREFGWKVDENWSNQIESGGIEKKNLLKSFSSPNFEKCIMGGWRRSDSVYPCQGCHQCHQGCHQCHRPHTPNCLSCLWCNLPKLPSCTNNRCRSADLGCAMTRMSNKLVYHFLPFNEPPAGVNRRGATLTRFLSSTHCIYGRDMGGIYIWEGYEEYMGGARKLKTLHAGFDPPSHPSLSTLF